ncbi:MAG: hypothetical protein ACJ8AT_13210 [Hyalangium sp.]|uniref:hypothetical protein n=1 Tax=Hyalangium sp. TaxID=2028555 RepID=UPI003899B193
MTPSPPPSRWLLLACSCVVLLAACGKSTPPPPPPPTPVTADQFAQQYAEAQCDRQGRCDLLAPYLVDQCKAKTADLIHAEDVTRAIAAGRLVYDEAQARSCLDGIQNTRCLAQAEDEAVKASCQAALHGTVQPGAACSFLYECAAGRCGGKEDTTCPSTCPEVLNAGDTCSTFRGFPCNDSAGLRCSGGMCVLPGDLNADCVDNNGCKTGLLCVDSKCVPLAKEGSGCSQDSSCADGLYCEGDVCVARKREGAKCSGSPQEVDAALRGSQCQEGLTCQGAGLDSEGNFLPGTCVKPTKEGEACQNTPADVQVYLTGCLSGLNCTNGRCTLPPSTGSCDPNDYYSCRPDQTYCSLSASTCQTLKPDGAACDIPPECASDNCPDGTCVPALVYCHE